MDNCRMEMCIEIDENKVPFIQIGDFILRLDLEELDNYYKQRAIEELRETPENVNFSLKKFREYIQAEPGLNLPIDDEKFLIKFLRPFKFYPDSAFKVLKKFYKFKLKHPKLGIDLYPSMIRHVFDEEVFVFLPSRTPCGSRIMLVNAGAKWNPKKVSLTDMFRAIMVAIEIAMMEPKTQLGGVEVIINMHEFALIHAYQITPHLAKLISDWVQECAPVRLKGIHIINQPYFFKMVYAIFKPFLGEKLKQKISFHGSNRESLCNKLSANSLPPYLGGTANIPEYPGKLFSDMLYYYEDTFKVCNTYCYVKEKAVDAD